MERCTTPEPDHSWVGQSQLDRPIEDNRVEKKLEEEPQDEDSCSQATTRGLGRLPTPSGKDPEVKKIKKTNRGTAYVNRKSFEGE